MKLYIPKHNFTFNLTVGLIIFYLLYFISDLLLNRIISFYIPNSILLISGIAYIAVVLFHKVHLLDNIGSFINKNPKLKRLVKSKFLLLMVCLLLVALFMLIEISNINIKGIGTDEGNTLIVLKYMLKDNLQMYLDFWTREPASILLLLPIFKFVPITIENLRIVVIIVHLLILYISLLAVRRYLNKTLLIVFLILALPLTLGLFNVFPGFFYQIWRLVYVIIIYAILQYIFNPQKGKLLYFFLGLMTGFAILVYKGGIVFLFIIPVIFYINHSKDLKLLARMYILFMFQSLLPIGLFTLFFSINTDVLHIYRVITGDIINIYIPLLALVPILFLVAHFHKLFDKVVKLLTYSNLVFLISLISIISISIIFIMFPTEVSYTLWGGVNLEAFFFLVPFLTMQLLYLDRKRRLIVFIFYTVFFFVIFIHGFGSRGFIAGLNIYEHIMFAIANILFWLWLLFISIRKDLKLKLNYIDEKVLATMLILINLMIASIFANTQITAFRIVMIIPIYLILIILSLKILYSHNKKVAYQMGFISFSFLLLTSALYIRYPDDYTLYSTRDYNNTVNYVSKNTTKDDYIFTGDLAIAAVVDSKLMVNYSTPWMYRDNDTPHYVYSGMSDKYPTDIDDTKEEINKKLTDLKPKFIIASTRLTLRTFFDDKNDPDNLFLTETFTDNYTLDKVYGRIRIYKLK